MGKVKKVSMLQRIPPKNRTKERRGKAQIHILEYLYDPIYLLDA